MYCVNCGNEIPDIAKFCPKCGAVVSVYEDTQVPDLNFPHQAAKKRKTIFGIAAAVAVVCIALSVVVMKVIIPNNNYNAAVALMDSGDYIAAYEVLGNLNGYKNSAELKSFIKSEYLNVGDSICFGSYEQDNDTSNGKEKIEWEILAEEDGKVLVISKYALDCQRYNTSDTGITWESCSLRKWMNGTFLETAFGSDEAAMIATSTVTADKNPENNTNEGNNTEDQVFLLSITEAEKYFDSDDARMCVPTAYAVAQGAFTSDSNSVGGNANCYWWLRSLGYGINFTAYVSSDGSVDCDGENVYSDVLCVRPALWINLEP